MADYCVYSRKLWNQVRGRTVRLAQMRSYQGTYEK